MNRREQKHTSITLFQFWYRRRAGEAALHRRCMYPARGNGVEQTQTKHHSNVIHHRDTFQKDIKQGAHLRTVDADRTRSVGRPILTRKKITLD